MLIGPPGTVLDYPPSNPLPSVSSPAKLAHRSQNSVTKGNLCIPTATPSATGAITPTTPSQSTPGTDSALPAASKPTTAPANATLPDISSAAPGLETPSNALPKGIPCPSPTTPYADGAATTTPPIGAPTSTPHAPPPAERPSPQQLDPSPGDAPGTSVHTEVTTADDLGTLSYRDSLLRFHRDEYLAAEQTYSIRDVSTGGNTLERLTDCRTGAWFAHHQETNQVVILSSSCKLRWCPMCSNARAYAIARGSQDWLRRTKSPKMLTLTLKHSSAPLGLQLNLLYNAFRQLRQRKLFTKNCRGGIWFFQIKFIKETQQWHPHIHALIDSRYIPQAALSTLWLALTQNSKIVDIRQVKDKREAAKYVSRYSARPALLSALPFEKRVEVVTELHGRRIVGTWSSARCVSLRPQNASTTGPWLTLGSFQNMSESANTDPVSLAVLQAWRNKTPLTAEIIKELYYREHPLLLEDDTMNSPTDPQLTFADFHPPPSQPAVETSP